MGKFIQFGKDLLERIDQADVTGLSAQLAFFFLLSLFPFLLFLVTLIGYLPMDESAVIEVLSAYLPEDVVLMIESNLAHIMENRHGGLLSLGVIGTLWSASNGMNAIKKCFNKAYGVEKEQLFITSRIISIGLTLAMIVVIAVALLLQVFGKTIGENLYNLFNFPIDYLQIWNRLRWVVSSAIFFIVFFFLYKLTPNTKVEWRHAIWGTLFATISWQLSTLAFSYYVNTLGNYSATYGSLGTVIVLMIWFYLSGIMITTGGVINAFLQQLEQGK